MPPYKLLPLLLALCTPATAGSLVGFWEGKLERGNERVPIKLDISSVGYDTYYVGEIHLPHGTGWGARLSSGYWGSDPFGVIFSTTLDFVETPATDEEFCFTQIYLFPSTPARFQAFRYARPRGGDCRPSPVGHGEMKQTGPSTAVPFTGYTSAQRKICQQDYSYSTYTADFPGSGWRVIALGIGYGGDYIYTETLAIHPTSESTWDGQSLLGLESINSTGTCEASLERGSLVGAENATQLQLQATGAQGAFSRIDVSK